MTLALRPYPLTLALAFNSATHRRRPRLQGGMWAVAIERLTSAGYSPVVGVAIVARPPPPLEDGRTLIVVRVACITDDENRGNKGACSILYGACAKTAKAHGARMFTYTDADEPGVSLRAAGWIDEGIQRNRGVDTRPGRNPIRGSVRRWRAP